jgi:hypothetical protein
MKLLFFLSSFALHTLVAADRPIMYSATPTAVIPWSPVQSPISVDQSAIYNSTYYITDRNIAGVHVVDLQTNTQITTIRGFFKGVFAPNGTLLQPPGPEGLVVVTNNNELWVGDADGSIKVIDLFTNTIVANITTDAKGRADEFAYDPQSNTVVVTSDQDTPPFVTIISSENYTILGKIPFPGATSIEQPAFNTVLNKFYIPISSYPQTPSLAGGAISSLDILNFRIGETFPVPECNPAGIAFPSKHSTHLFIGCSGDQIATFNYAASYIMNVRLAGRIVANISMLSGIDQVVYSASTNAFYAAAFEMTVDGRNGSTPMPMIGIVDAKELTLTQTILTNDTELAHSVSVDGTNGNMVVPIRQSGIMVFSLLSQAGDVDCDCDE